MTDLLMLAAGWGRSQGELGYNLTCDLNNDGTVDIVDLLTLADDWGK